VPIFLLIAVIVLSGFGIGPETAGRILRGYIKDEEELLRSIYRAEKIYVTTRGFWED
jgi:ATP-dependent Lhr-like helicase